MLVGPGRRDLCGWPWLARPGWTLLAGNQCNRFCWLTLAEQALPAGYGWNWLYDWFVGQVAYNCWTCLVGHGCQAGTASHNSPRVAHAGHYINLSWLWLNMGVYDKTYQAILNKMRLPGQQGRTKLIKCSLMGHACKLRGIYLRVVQLI